MKGQFAYGLVALLSLAVLILINALSEFIPIRIDLTEEKRFTLTKATEELLDQIEDPILIEVLLEGDFPAGFARLRDATEEMLKDFEDRSSSIEFVFQNPLGENEQEQAENSRNLAEIGLRPVTFFLQTSEGRSERPIYPYAIVNYRSQKVVINLLENNVPGQSPDVAINNSISLLEYKLINAIQKILRQKKPFIAFVEGHNELAPLQTKDLSQSLSPYYNVIRVALDTLPGLLPEEIGALIIAEPETPFSEREKFVLDQYLMRGGRVMMLVDKLAVNLDSLRRPGPFIPPDRELNLDDLLFKYGLRIEPNLILDLQSTPIPLAVGQLGSAAQFELRTWPYHVLANPNPSHPITRSLEPVQLYYPSEIDTTVLTKTALRKTPLLLSTSNAQLRYSPARLSFEDARFDPDPAQFKKGPFVVGVLLEGELPSLYENRVSSEFQAALDRLQVPFRNRSTDARLIVVSDGDLAKNAIDPVAGDYKPLGYNEFVKNVFDNKEFMLNAIEYLFDTDGIISARNREVKLRLLDAPRAQQEKVYWRLLNVGLPLFALLLFGVSYNYLRRRRYARA